MKPHDVYMIGGPMNGGRVMTSSDYAISFTCLDPEWAREHMFGDAFLSEKQPIEPKTYQAIYEIVGNLALYMRREDD